ncbi:hypothetical protein JKP88DRAFT_290303 [Tribonema minus]|uniref:Uncharacterized protein n=1 Tax=Tribonema minus TaxID=303371 RepID=A0A835YXY0_9STRA|nr:hypothetical protein JKP88DRAFT_290303 [Tribonema minus]
MTAARSPPVSPYAQRIERPDPYRMKVYDEGLAFQIRQPVPTAMTEDAKRLRLAEKYALEQARLQAETERLVQERKAARTAAKEAQYTALYGDVMAGHDLVDELDRAMDIVDSAEYNKRLKQHSEWTQNVYGAIQAQIRQQIDAMDPKALSKQKQDDYQLFLDEANRKPAIFRDIVVESEYDPFEVNRRAIKARVPKLVDPTSRPTDRTERWGSCLAQSMSQLRLGVGAFEEVVARLHDEFSRLEGIFEDVKAHAGYARMFQQTFDAWGGVRSGNALALAPDAAANLLEACGVTLDAAALQCMGLYADAQWMRPVGITAGALAMFLANEGGRLVDGVFNAAAAASASGAAGEDMLAMPQCVREWPSSPLNASSALFGSDVSGSSDGGEDAGWDAGNGGEAWAEDERKDDVDAIWSELHTLAENLRELEMPLDTLRYGCGEAK